MTIMTDRHLSSISTSVWIISMIASIFIGSWFVGGCQERWHLMKIEQHLERIAEAQK